MRGILVGLFISFALIVGAPSSFAIQDSKEVKTEKPADEKKAKKEKQAKITIIHAGTLLAVPGTDPLMKQSVVIKDKKIVGIHDGFVSGDDIEHPEATIVDMSDKFVMPGLMDMHVHMLSGVRGSGNGRTPADQMLNGAQNSYNTLMAGYTTVRDLGAPSDDIHKLTKRINKGDIIGPRIISAGITIGVGGRSNGRECNGVESCRKTTRDNISKGAKWIKIYSSCSGFQMCSKEDGAPVFFADEMQAVFDVAAKYKVPVATHSHPRASALFMLKYNIKSIEHGTFMNTRALKLMKKKGVTYVPTVAVWEFLDKMQANPKTPPAVVAHNQLFKDAQPETVMEAYKLGVKIATGSDAGVSYHGQNYKEITRLVGLGISKKDVLKMATVNGAALLEEKGLRGTIAKGTFADIIAIDGNPLEDENDMAKVTFVMKAGRIYKD